MEFNNWCTNYFQGHFYEQNFCKRFSTTFSNLQENLEKKTCIYSFIQIIFINTFDFSRLFIVDEIEAKGDTNFEGPSNAGEAKKEEKPQKKKENIFLLYI